MNLRRRNGTGEWGGEIIQGKLSVFRISQPDASRGPESRGGEIKGIPHVLRETSD